MTAQANDRVPDARRERAMVIVAHPDDADHACAGTVAKWVREGLELTLVVITDGGKGSDNPVLTPERLIPIRLAEQRAAASCLGVRDVVFLMYEDGALEDTPALRRDLVRLIRERRPDRLICLDPTSRWLGRGYLNHPDHIAGGSAALAAVFPLARNRSSFRELLALGLEPHRVHEVYLTGTSSPDTWIDVGDTLDLKIQALQQHRSQVDGAAVGEMLRERARRCAQGHGMEYAEDFRYFELA